MDLNDFKIQDQSIAYRYVKNSGCAIRFVENPSDSLKILAIENATCPDTLSFISWGSNQSNRYIVDPSEEMQLVAVNQSYKYIREIADPTEKVVE